MKSIKEKQKEAFKALKDVLGYKNVMQTPRLLKAVVSAGVGSFKDKKKIEVVQDRLAKITGQKAAIRGAKKSIATYKSRTGDTVGTQVTLRGPRMYAFLDKLQNSIVPSLNFTKKEYPVLFSPSTSYTQVQGSERELAIFLALFIRPCVDRMLLKLAHRNSSGARPKLQTRLYISIWVKVYARSKLFLSNTERRKPCKGKLYNARI